MTTPPALGPDDLAFLGDAAHRSVDWITRYWESLQERRVTSERGPGQTLAMLPELPPEQGWDATGPTFDAFLTEMDRVIVPGLTHWQAPHFYGFFPCNASPPGIVGEILAAGLNVNVMMWATSPAATELETRMLDWMAHALGLPAVFQPSNPNGGGCIQGTASEATLAAMVAARERAFRAHGEQARLVGYVSPQAHSSVMKAGMVAGPARGLEDRRILRAAPIGPDLAIDAAALGDMVRQDIAAGRLPFFTCATVGTTSSLAMDPVDAIARSLNKAGALDAWLHVDAAHAGCAWICPEHRHLAKGLDHADSVCVNPHKWLLTNFDCDLFWTRDRAALTGALSVTPEYLRNAASDAGAVVDYRDWGVPLGRRFRALKLWVVLRHYGLERLREHVRAHVRLAENFADWVRADSDFEIAAPPQLNLVCFRVRGPDNGPTRALLEALRADRRVLITHTTLDIPTPGTLVLRMAIGATTTTERHVREAWDIIRDLHGRTSSAPRPEAR